MMIQVKCGSCGRQYKLPDETAGKRARCKACGEAMAIPAAKPAKQSDDDPLGLGSSGDPNAKDLSSLYGQAAYGSGSAMPLHEGEAVGFNPEVSFSAQTKHSAGKSLDMKLVAIAGGGALVLLIVVGVVLALVLGGGVGDDDAAGGSGLAVTGGAAANSSSSGSGFTPLTPEYVERDDPAGKPDDDDALANGPDDDGTDPDGSAGTAGGDADDDADDADEDEAIEPDGPLASGYPDRAGESHTFPTRGAFGIVLPEGVEYLMSTRIAVRAAPAEDGFWLSMEVHKLSGLDRRLASPISADGATLMRRGHRVEMPEGVEVSELELGEHKVHRLLYPVAEGQPVGVVEYVLKDGPYVVTVLGRYPADQPERLEQLDAAALSVRPKPWG